MRTQRQAFSDLVAFVPPGFNRIPVRTGEARQEAQAELVERQFIRKPAGPCGIGPTLGMGDEKSHAFVAVWSDAWWLSGAMGGGRGGSGAIPRRRIDALTDAL
jgi:hypothetical protein